MKRNFPILLSLAGCLLLYSQAQNGKSSLLQITSLPKDLSDQIVSAQRTVLDQQSVLRNTTDPSKVDVAKKALAQAQTTIETLAKQTAPSGSGSTLATAEQKTELLQAITTFYDETAKPLAELASRWETSLVFASLGFGVLSSILSSFSWNRTSAAVSVLVVLASGIPNAYPIHDRALYFQTLSNQTDSLMMKVSLSSTLSTPLSLSEYDDDVRRAGVIESSTQYQPAADGGSSIGPLLRALNATKIGAPACP